MIGACFVPLLLFFFVRRHFVCDGERLSRFRCRFGNKNRWTSRDLILLFFNLDFLHDEVSIDAAHFGYYHVSLGFLGLYWVLLSLTWFYWVSLGFTGFYLVLMDFTGLYWVLLSLSWFYWVLLGFTGFYWVLLGFNGFYWVVLGFT